MMVTEATSGHQLRLPSTRAAGLESRALASPPSEPARLWSSSSRVHVEVLEPRSAAAGGPAEHAARVPQPPGHLGPARGSEGERRSATPRDTARLALALVLRQPGTQDSREHP